MDVECLEISDFLRRHVPFDRLPEAALQGLPARLHIRYLRRGTTLAFAADTQRPVNIVRSGAIEARDEAGELTGRYAEGELFGYADLTSRFIAASDTLLYQLPRESLNTLCDQHAVLAGFFKPAGAERLREGLTGGLQESLREGTFGRSTPIDLLGGVLGDALDRPPVSLPPSASIRDGARLMSQEHISSLLIMEDDQLRGIVTDRDLRLRVIADAVSTDLPLSRIMTSDPVTMQLEENVHDALQLMTRRRIHHLPVLSGDRVAGVLTTTDFLNRDSTSGVYLAADIDLQDNIAGLQAVCERIPAVLGSVLASGASAARIERIMTNTREAVVARLMTIAVRELGEPPVPYAWAMAGQHTDVIVIDNACSAQHRSDWFAGLYQRVREGLNRCTGLALRAPDAVGSMCLSVQGWRELLQRCMDHPDAEELGRIGGLFDMRGLVGSCALVDEVTDKLAQAAGAQQSFLVALGTSATLHRPPVWCSRESMPDLYRDGVKPIVDLVRVQALAAGIDATDVQTRLQALRDVGRLDAVVATDLQEAYDFVFRAQLAADLRRPGDVPLLSPLERHHLQDVFAIIRHAQDQWLERCVDVAT